MKPTRTGVTARSLLAALVAGASFQCRSAAAQGVEHGSMANGRDESTPSEVPTDYLLARDGGFSATVASGVPFLGIGELAYGVTDRFTVGAFGAATPDLGSAQGTVAIGIRPRGALFVAGSWRSVVVVPVLYYPRVPGFGGRDPWMLTRPTVTLERASSSGARVSVGL